MVEIGSVTADILLMLSLRWVGGGVKSFSCQTQLLFCWVELSCGGVGVVTKMVIHMMAMAQQLQHNCSCQKILNFKSGVSFLILMQYLDIFGHQKMWTIISE